MGRTTGRVALTAVLGWATIAGAQSAQPATAAAIVARTESELFIDVPAPWRDYFIAARRAERIEDPLARCLAYPDLPGTAWPAGYGSAHCHYHLDEPLTLAQVAAFVDAGDVAGLERRIREIYAHHREPDGEGVHRIWGDFSAGGDEAERIAARWSELAPKSGYAALASAEVLRGRGWDARGTRRIGDTPPEAIRAMDAYFAKARAGFRRAIELQPDLLDAYIGLVDIGRSDGDGAAEAFARAQALDPGCGELAFRHMQGLQPRWGGSQMAMLSYAGELRPLVSARPLLANQQSTPLSDYVGWSADDRYAPESLDLLDEAVRLSGEEASLRAASDARRRIAGPRRDVPRAVAEQLQLGRFGEREAWGDRLVAQYLVRRDPTWARRVMAHGVALDPGDTFGRYLLGAANYNAGAYDEAERQYLLAAEGDDERRDALRELSAMWLYDAGLPPAAAAVRAEPFVDRLLAAFPDDGRGLFMRMHVHSMRDPRHAIAPGDLQAFLDHADRDDPWQRWRLEHLRQAMPARTPAAAAKPARR